MKVPFNDLSRIHNPLKEKVLAKFSNVVDKNDFILNKDVENFEKSFSHYTKQKYSISCSNGTDALELILRGLEIGAGDEVIVPINTFIATSFSVENVGAMPVFVDNDEYYLIDVEKIQSKITKKTKAIIGVNLYGQMCDVDKLYKISKDNNIKFIEDAAQSHGAMQGKRNVGDKSIAAAYSFYPGKNLGGWGDGGIVTTNSQKLFKKLEKIRNFGSKVKYYHEIQGINSKLQPLQAILLKEKLQHLDSWNKEREAIALNYLEELKNIKEITLPKYYKNNKHVWHLFVLRVPNRKNFIEFCNEHNIETGIHYPYPILKQKSYIQHPQKLELFENSYSQYRNLVSLPIFPKMTKEEINYVISVVKKYFSKS